uniref:Caspase-1 n=1 Tax=Varanus komodoensis TaxID=61221 RepID=A0A8D2J6G4_VARKO
MRAGRQGREGGRGFPPAHKMLAQKQTGGRGTRALAASCGPPGTAAVKGPSSSAIHSVVDNQLPQQETLKGECSSALPPKSPAAAGAHGHAASDPGGGINHQERQPWAALSGHRSSPLSELPKSRLGQIYPIKDPKARTRLALIVCNIEFEHCTRRNGAEIDLAQMTQLLEGLDYKVEVETNLCSQVEKARHFAAREEHKASDSTFVVLMSHGLRDGLCGTKSSEQHPDILPVDLVFSTFNNKNCRALRGKPKVIIIQACRGGMCAVGAPEGLEKDTIQKVHVESDFICLYSTTPDNVSWRSPQTGSIFIVQLVEEIKKHAWNCNLEEIFRKVMWAFESNPCQMPSKDRTTLSRKFYLFPGH